MVAFLIEITNGEDFPTVRAIDFQVLFAYRKSLQEEVELYIQAEIKSTQYKKLAPNALRFTY